MWKSILKLVVYWYEADINIQTNICITNKVYSLHVIIMYQIDMAITVYIYKVN